MVCYHCLVVLTAWFTGIDSIAYYRDIQYAPIADAGNRRNRRKQSRNPFDTDGDYEDDEDMDRMDDANAYSNNEQYGLGMYGQC